MRLYDPDAGIGSRFDSLSPPGECTGPRDIHHDQRVAANVFLHPDDVGDFLFYLLATGKKGATARLRMETAIRALFFL